MPGFGPAADPLLFRQKWTKSCWPWHGPSGALRGSPTSAASKLAEPVLSLVEGLKHCPPFLRCRLHGSALPPGQGVLFLRTKVYDIQLLNEWNT